MARTARARQRRQTLYHLPTQRPRLTVDVRHLEGPVRFLLIHLLRAIKLTLNGAFGFQFQGPVLVILLEALLLPVHFTGEQKLVYIACHPNRLLIN